MKRAIAVLASAIFAAVVHAQTAPPKQHEVIEVTATKIAEDVTVVPQSITVIDGDAIRARGAYDLTSALTLTAGVSVSPGGDAGPAGSVPEMWGIREADAFLLVVDGVPWGGAFNPDLPSLDLTDVDRIEVLRGAAPVMYGATSFTGVIHVIHREAGAPGAAHAAIGNYSSGRVAATFPIAQKSSFRQSITANYDRRGFSGDRSGYDRTHLLYRSAADVAGGTLRFDLDGVSLKQSPSSPHPRIGTALSSLFRLDANANLAGSKIDEDRLHGVVGFETQGAIPWTTTLALTRSRFDVLRGFLGSVLAAAPNASGYTQQRHVTDAYFDSHFVRKFGSTMRLVAGVDHLFGSGRAESGLFDYFIPLTGGMAPRFNETWVDEETRLDTRRNFSGAYAQTEWTLGPRFRLDAGARLNHTSERRQAQNADGSETQSRSVTRGSGGMGATWLAVKGADSTLALFSNYRNTFKPAAIDFGPDAEPDILRPESGVSYEIGAKGRFHQRVEWEVSAFRNDLTNLLVAATVNGQPQLQNSGKIRVNGAEGELRATISSALRGELAYAYHDARFRDYLFEGTTQLAGNRFEMSPLHLASAGLLYTPASGPFAHAEVGYTGPRYLNKRNTAPAGGYTSLSAGLGYNAGRGTMRIDGWNLTNRRPPIAESELGDAQYYRLPARSLELSYAMRF
jgi:iron complex outermembrane recepter protein